MKKSQFKKYLHIFDKIESNLLTRDTVYETFISYINEKDYGVHKDKIKLFTSKI